MVVDEKQQQLHTYEERGELYSPAAASMGRPSLEALAMAGADWKEARAAGAGVGVVVDDEGLAPPPEHLRAFDAFLEEVVPADMLLAFGRGERERGRPRSREEDVKEKLKLWAKAVARKVREQITRDNDNACVRVR